MLRAGQLDGMLSTTEGIGGHLYFSDSYIVYQNVATTLTSRNIKLRQIEDLANYSVSAFQSANLLLGERFNAVASNHSDYREVPLQITGQAALGARGCGGGGPPDFQILHRQAGTADRCDAGSDLSQHISREPAQGVFATPACAMPLIRAGYHPQQRHV
jgi:hypothetical protein